MASAHGFPPHLLPPTYKRLVASWLEEDCPTFDHGGFVVGDSPATAHLYCKSPGVLAGVPFFDEIFRQLNCTVHWLVEEGASLDLTSSSLALPPSASSSTTTTSTAITNGNSPSDITTPPQTKLHIATVTGPTHALLLGERTALNTLARCSGIATASANLLSTLRRTHHFRGALAGTRKTTPGFRLPEKYSMVVGGADMHRVDLSAMVMLKDNHVAAFRRGRRRERRGEGGGVGELKDEDEVEEQGASVARVIAAAKAVGGFSVKVEVEAGSVIEAEQAVRGGADVVMLDNFRAAEVGPVARALKTMDEAKGVLIEVSGGITSGWLDGGEVDLDGVDVLSTSAIHQGVQHVDFSLKIVQEAEARVES